MTTPALDDALEAAITAWLTDDPDPATQLALTHLRDRARDGDPSALAEITDAFAGPLTFGTAGLRGALGPGPGRMNRVVVARAAAGLAGYLVDQGLAGGRVIVGYDARYNSDVFAADTAEILAGAGLKPLLCLTKADLASPEELLAQYGPLDVAIQVTRPGADLSSLRQGLAGHRSVFVGHSGVGKSTLVNALIPDAQRAIGSVNEVTGRGRHTSTSAIALRLPPDPAIDGDPGWVIDTPGVRSFGLSHVSPKRIVAAFDDLAALVADCPRGCTHTDSEPECALDEAVRRGELSPARLESFRRMLGSGQ